jgi:3-hydroxyacyl-CoA dehydrogenase
MGPRHRAGAGAIRRAHPGVRRPAGAPLARRRTRSRRAWASWPRKAASPRARSEKTLDRIEIADSLAASPARIWWSKPSSRTWRSKRELFAALEKIVTDDCILASNPSSLS